MTTDKYDDCRLPINITALLEGMRREQAHDIMIYDKIFNFNQESQFNVEICHVFNYYYHGKYIPSGTCLTSLGGHKTFTVESIKTA